MCKALNVKNTSDALIEIDLEDKRSIGETDLPNINSNMIYYCWHDEAWLDTENDKFSQSMTPEGEDDFSHLEFENEDIFWDWYYQNE